MIPIPKPGSKLIPMFSVKLKKFRTLNELRGGMMVMATLILHMSHVSLCRS